MVTICKGCYLLGNDIDYDPWSWGVAPGLGGAGFVIHSNKPRIAGVRLKPPPQDARRYFETRSPPDAPSGSIHSERFPANRIYADIRRNRPAHTERDRVAAREERRRIREEREHRARQGLRAIEYLREPENSEPDGEGWGIRAQPSRRVTYAD